MAAGGPGRVSGRGHPAHLAQLAAGQVLLPIRDILFTVFMAKRGTMGYPLPPRSPAEIPTRTMPATGLATRFSVPIPPAAAIHDRRSPRARPPPTGACRPRRPLHQREPGSLRYLPASGRSALTTLTRACRPWTLHQGVPP